MNGLTMSIEIDKEGLMEGITALIKDVNSSQPEKAVTVECPHAFYVEFGSDPASSKGQMVMDDGVMITESRKAIRDWVGYKLGKTGADRAKIGDAIWNKIMVEGVAPNPYFRPALHHTEENLPDYVTMAISMSSDDIAGYIANRMAEYMKQIVLEKDIVAKGELLASIRVKNANEVALIANALKDITEAVWDSDTSDKHGNEREGTGRNRK